MNMVLIALRTVQEAIGLLLAGAQICCALVLLLGLYIDGAESQKEKNMMHTMICTFIVTAIWIFISVITGRG